MRLAITRSWIRVSRLLMVILLQSRNMNVPSGAGVGKNGAEERNQTHGPAPRYSENEPDIVRLRGIRSARHRRAWRRGASRRPDHRQRYGIPAFAAALVQGIAIYAFLLDRSR